MAQAISESTLTTSAATSVGAKSSTKFFGGINFFDFAVVSILLLGGFLYQQNSFFWSQEQVGLSQTGDADFWWCGALHVAKGLLNSGYGQGFRPGYFFLAGFPEAILNGTFAQFHKFFLVAFIGACGLFYLACSRALGRVTMACAVLALVFSPFTAEWVSTSTTDATGMMLNMVALSLLFTSVLKVSTESQVYSEPINRWQGNLPIALSGFLFTLANVTRPLMAPFALLAAAALFTVAPPKRRFEKSLCFLLAFAAPLFIWMAVQKALVGEASISQNDASAFYSASDPKIQVWDSNIYEPVAKSINLKCQNYAADATLNKEFWRRTIDNYKQHYRYHLRRILPHVWAIADFSSRRATVAQKLSIDWLLLRTLLGVGLCVALIKAFQKKTLQSTLDCLLPGALLSVTFLPNHHFAPVVLAGVLYPWLQRKSSTTRFCARLVSLYWLVGVGALYLTGGTAGSAKNFGLFITGLGYRLSDQFYFAALVCAFYVSASACTAAHSVPRSDACNDSRSAAGESSLPFGRKLGTLLQLERPWLSRVVLGVLSVIGASVVLSEAVGAGVVFYRSNSNAHSPVRAYPSTRPVLETAAKVLGASKIALSPGGTPVLKLRTVDGNKTNSADGNKTDSADELFCGSVGELVWDLDGQKRTSLVIYPQDNIVPLRLHPNRIVADVPENSDAARWRWKRGAFIVRAIPAITGKTDYPWYLTRPVVRGFAPLKPDGSGFDITHAEWFPIRKYATDLVASGDLDLGDAQPQIEEAAGHYARARHFLIAPRAGQTTVVLRLRNEHLTAPARLTFSLDRNISDGADAPVRISCGENSGFDLTEGRLSVGFALPGAGEKGQTEIRFDDVPKSGLWVYEFNVEAHDFKY